MWWDTLDDLHAAVASADGAEAMQMLLEDESTFIDFAGSTIFMTEEHKIFDHTAAPDGGTAGTGASLS